MKRDLDVAIRGPTEGEWRCCVYGPVGSGQSRAALGRLRHLLGEGIPGHQILLLVSDRSTGSLIRDELVATQTRPFGAVDPQTYYSMAARFTRLFWPLIASPAGFADPSRPPVLLNYEMAQHLLGQLIQPLLKRGYFEGLSLRPQRIVSQLIDNLNRAAVNGYPFAEVASRLTDAWNGDAARVRTYEQAQECIDLFRKHCLRHGLLDLSLSVWVFAAHLCAADAFSSFLVRRYRHLVVDQLEETVPVAQDLVRRLLGTAESSLLCCDPEGGYRSFLGADPEGAWELGRSCGEQVELKAAELGAKKLFVFLDRVTAELQQGAGVGSGQGTRQGSVRLLQTRFRVEMIREIGRQITALTKAGTAPGEIAVVAPLADGGLRFLLGQVLSEAGVPFKIIRRYENLFEEKIVRSGIVAALLAHPGWDRRPSVYEVSEALSAILKRDPIRSRLAANLLYDPHSGRLKAAAELDDKAGSRLGTEFLAAVDALRGWIHDYLTRAPEHIDHFLRRLFSASFFRTGLETHDVEIFSKLVSSAAAFRRTAPFLGLATAEIGAEYVSMLDGGVVAAQYTADSGVEVEPEAVTLIAPVYTFLLSRQRARVQFWLDIGSPSWWEPLHQPLTNHQVLARRWNVGEQWTDLIDYRARNRTLSRLLRGLVRRCDERVILCNSELDAGGNPQQGPLLYAAGRVLDQPS